jgi:hypothetical protein
MVSRVTTSSGLRLIVDGGRGWRELLDLTAKGVFDDGLERGVAAGGDRLGLDEQIVRKIQGGFHMWVTIWFCG